MKVKVLLELTVEDAPDREVGEMDVNKVGADVAAYAGDWLYDRTRKEFAEPWRIIDVKLAQ